MRERGSRSRSASNIGNGLRRHTRRWGGSLSRCWRPNRRFTTCALACALGSDVFIGEITDSLALAYLLRHDLSQAEATLAAALPRDQIPRSFAERRMTLAWGELALAQDASDRALRIAEQLIESAPGAARGQPIPALLKLKGAALLALRRVDAAVQVLEQARRAAEAQGLRPLLWQILRALGQTQQRLGWRKEARHTFAAERFGGLTDRERAVAALIAQGKSNQEIATALVVSKRTVETHVGNIMAKLGATTRAHVVAWAVMQGLALPSS